MRNTINITDGQTGALLNLSERIKRVTPTLNNASIIDAITMSSGSPKVGWMIKKSKRTQTVQSERTGLGSTQAFKGANAQVINREFIDRTTREDNIAVSRLDVAKLREGTGGDVIAQETGDFLLTARELDVKKLLSDVRAKAVTNKIYSSVAKVDADALYATKATGVQPTLADNKTDTNKAAIDGGLRIAKVDDIDASSDNRIKLLRAIIGYALRLGAGNSIEEFYPGSINGLPADSLKILTTYTNCIAIKDSFTQTVVNLNSPGSTRNLNGLVGFIDTVKVFITNQMKPEDAYNVVSNRIAVRDMDPIVNYVGTIKEAGSYVDSAGTHKNLKPSEMLLQFESARIQGAFYHEEFWAIELV